MGMAVVIFFFLWWVVGDRGKERFVLNRKEKSALTRDCRTVHKAYNMLM